MTIYLIFTLALLATAGFGVNKSMNGNANLNDLALANVEALANEESGGEHATIQLQQKKEVKFCIVVHVNMNQCFSPLNPRTKLYSKKCNNFVRL